MAAEGGDIVRFTYTGADDEDIPNDATHVFVNIKTIPARAFMYHHNIIEVICHANVEEIEVEAFYCCSLRRVIMRGVKMVGEGAFDQCRALEDVQCGELEIIKQGAFGNCKSLRSINLPSARIVEESAFSFCRVLKNVKFGSLERFDEGAFDDCRSLERITIPLKDGMINDEDIFVGCENLNHVDLVEGALLHETIAALHMEDWRNDMNEEIDSINQILLTADAGGELDNYEIVPGEKAQVIRRWLRSVLRKIINYQAEHQRVLEEAADTLGLALPRDIAMNNVLSFLELPSHSFGVDDRGD